jgi:aspartate-semialdehyde dehydrogenase
MIVLHGCGGSLMRHVAIVGATGAVGQEFRKVLSKRNFPAEKYTLLASARSAGKQVEWIGGTLTVQELTAESFAGVDLALFSAGGSISKEFAPAAQAAGAVVVDNSSAFRMVAEVPLVVPESESRRHQAAQGHYREPELFDDHHAGAALAATSSGAGQACGGGYLSGGQWGRVAKALAELESQSRAVLAGESAQPEVFPVPCAFNCFSHNTAIGEDGMNVEERKMVQETHKMFHDDSIRIAATCMRVPVMRAHTEALTIEFAEPMPEARAREILSNAPGVKVVDDREKNYFPMPIDASDQDDVLVGRIRQDPSLPDQRGIQLICSGDQLLKGAALNAVQIAERV